jgi:hypothetical protein
MKKRMIVMQEVSRSFTFWRAYVASTLAQTLHMFTVSQGRFRQKEI